MNGTIALGNLGDGVDSDVYDTGIGSNVISGNSGNGIALSDTVRFAFIQDNLIGTNANGTFGVDEGGKAFSNFRDGVNSDAGNATFRAILSTETASTASR